MITFDAVLEPGRSGGAFVTLPEEVVAALGHGTRFRARGTVGGAEYRSSTTPMGAGRTCLGIHKATRQAAGIGFGEQVRVEIEVDPGSREVVVPPALASALESADLRAVFDRLAPSRRRELASGVADARKPETRDRRIAAIIAGLSAS